MLKFFYFGRSSRTRTHTHGFGDRNATINIILLYMFFVLTYHHMLKFNLFSCFYSIIYLIKNPHIREENTYGKRFR